MSGNTTPNRPDGYPRRPGSGQFAPQGAPRRPASPQYGPGAAPARSAAAPRSGAPRPAAPYPRRPGSGQFAPQGAPRRPASPQYGPGAAPARSAAAPRSGAPRPAAPGSRSGVSGPRFGSAAARPGAPAVFGQDAHAYARGTYGNGRGNHGGHGGRGGKRGIGWKIALAVAVVVLVASLGTLAFIGWSYWSGTKTYDEIAEQAFKEPDADDLANMTVDWDLLAQKNPDVVGWVYVPGTTISYPIVQGESDDSYLYVDFTGATNPIVHKGSIFLSEENASDFSDGGCFIYGHNMNDDTMFGPIMDMLNQEGFDAARTVYVLTPTMNYRARTFAIDVVPSTSTSLIQPGLSDDGTMAAYVNDRIADSEVSRPDDVDATAFSKIFAFITCGDDYASTRAILYSGVVEQAVPAEGGAIVVDNGGAVLADADGTEQQSGQEAAEAA